MGTRGYQVRELSQNLGRFVGIHLLLITLTALLEQKVLEDIQQVIDAL